LAFCWDYGCGFGCGHNVLLHRYIASSGPAIHQFFHAYIAGILNQPETI